MADIKITKSKDGFEFKIESSKTERPLVVYKTEDGYVFYAVKFEGGSQVPKELSGTWTSKSAALKDVLKHLETKKPTVRKAVNDRSKERMAEKEVLNGTKPVSEAS